MDLQIPYGKDEKLNVNLPDNEMITTSFWLTIGQRLFLELGFNRQQAVDAVNGINDIVITPFRA